MAHHFTSKSQKETKDPLQMDQDRLLFGNASSLSPSVPPLPKTSLGRAHRPFSSPAVEKHVVDLGNRAPILGAFTNSNPKVFSKHIKQGLTHDLVITNELDQLAVLTDSDDESKHQPHASLTWSQSHGTPLSASVLQDVLDVLFPSKIKNFGEEWTGKGFVFRDHESLRYGLLQVKVDIQLV